MEEERGGPVGPFEDLEVVRVDVGMPTSRSCSLVGVPERTWPRWQAKARGHASPKGLGPKSIPGAAKERVVKHTAAHTARVHSKIWAMTRPDGVQVSVSTLM